MTTLYAPTVFIPQRHQAAPNKEQSQYRQAASGIYVTPNVLNDTELRSSLYVALSQIHGLGLFAQREYTRHDTIWYEQLRGGRTGIEDEGPLRWTNHSDDPNSVLVLDSEGSLETRLVALKSIQIGDEITYDYNRFGHSGSKSACNCGNGNCGGSFVMRSEWGERK